MTAPRGPTVGDLLKLPRAVRRRMGLKGEGAPGLNTPYIKKQEPFIKYVMRQDQLEDRRKALNEHQP